MAIKIIIYGRGGQLQIVRDRLQNFLQARDRPVNDALQKSQKFPFTFSVLYLISLMHITAVNKNKLLIKIVYYNNWSLRFNE